MVRYRRFLLIRSHFCLLGLVRGVRGSAPLLMFHTQNERVKMGWFVFFLRRKNSVGMERGEAAFFAIDAEWNSGQKW